jgi:hypothetical protein
MDVCGSVVDSYSEIEHIVVSRIWRRRQQDVRA